MFREDNPSSPAVGPRRLCVRTQARRDAHDRRWAHCVRTVRARLPRAAARGPQHRPRAAAAQRPRHPESRPAARDQRRLRARAALERRGGERRQPASTTRTTRTSSSRKSTSAAIPRPASRLFQSQNVASARIYGAELTATGRLGDWMPRLEGWTARLSAAWARGDDLDRDEPLNSVDPASAVLGLRLRVSVGSLGRRTGHDRGRLPRAPWTTAGRTSTSPTATSRSTCWPATTSATACA